MIKVLFYHANTLYFEDLKNTLFLSVAAIYFKTYIEVNNKDVADKIEWLRPIQKKITDDELLELCNTNQVDLLCISMYLWNESFFQEQLSRVKSKLNPTCKIVAGGPSVDVHINQNFFQKHNYIDYAIYGPGETAFLDLIEHIVNQKKLIAFNVSNLAWFDKEKNKQIVAEYKNVPQSQISPFLYNENFFSDIVKHEQQTNGLDIVVPYELTRGCPYSCTFCDWNSGLSTKVTRRKNTYQYEIDLFQKLGLEKIVFCDSNFGQYQEDIDLVEYLVHKNLYENTKFKTDGSLSKLRKDNNLKIYHLFAKGDLVAKGWGFTFSVQDINQTVLKNINRPDVGWEVHKKMILELYQYYPQYVSKVQFIIGLPGQTPSTVVESLLQIIALPNVLLSAYINEWLPASPAGLDSSYQQKFNFVYSDSIRINQGGFTFKGKFPASCISFDQRQFVEMTVLTSFIAGLAILRQEIKLEDLTSIHNAKLITEKFLQSEQYKFLTDNLYENWTEHDKFFYTLDFDRNYKIVPACTIPNAGSKWVNSVTFKKMLVQLDLIGISKKTLVKKIIDQQPLESWFKETA